MGKLLCLEDSYLKECGAVVEKMLSPTEAALDQTVFYPRGGGQPSDTGKIISGGAEYAVLEVSKKDGVAVHRLDKPGLAAGMEVKCVIDWERRYKLMRSHTAAHILATVMARDAGALITGNQLDTDKTRFDFSLANFDRELMDRMVAAANEEIAKGARVKAYPLAREEAMKIPGIVKLATALPPDIPVFRIVEIKGIDVQADGGTHVKNTSEIGKISIIRMENKGKENRRIYFELVA
ncbi:MAG: alanyl-tRNA editing protein [Candidatus Micrarchaeia archaeon]